VKHCTSAHAARSDYRCCFDKRAAAVNTISATVAGRPRPWGLL